MDTYVYGTTIPLYKSVYAALAYVSGPLAPYLYMFIIIGFFTFYYSIFKLLNKLRKVPKLEHAVYSNS